MYNRNAAYDFGALERQKRRGQLVELPGRLARKKERLKSKRTFLMAVFSAFMVSATVVSGFVMGQVTLTELTAKTEEASKLLDECESSNTQLHMQLETQGALRVANNGSVHNELVRIPKENLVESH